MKSDDISDLLQKIEESVQQAPRLAQFEAALTKINEIRHSIVSGQVVTWNIHVNALITVLEEAGFHGDGADKAQIEAEAMVCRIAELEAELAVRDKKLEELLALDSKKAPCGHLKRFTWEVAGTRSCHACQSEKVEKFAEINKSLHRELDERAGEIEALKVTVDVLRARMESAAEALMRP